MDWAIVLCMGATCQQHLWWQKENEFCPSIFLFHTTTQRRQMALAMFSRFFFERFVREVEEEPRQLLLLAARRRWRRDRATLGNDMPLLVVASVPIARSTCAPLQALVDNFACEALLPAVDE